MKSKSKIPVSSSIDTVDDLLSWVPDKYTIKKQSFIKIKEIENHKEPKTMICHDMMNGYLNDKFDQGSEDFGAFNFWVWQNIDVFIYFSHKFISIPPFVWRVAAHRNNVPILATFIIEGKGQQQTLNKLFSGKNFECTLCNLVDLCQFYQFDGYLINLESKVDEKFVYVILKFLNCLKNRLLKKNPCSHVIWYDSIVHNGELSYQDCVNSKNSLFFDNSSAFYTNYNWNISHLVQMSRFVQSRISDIYVGIDLFPRKKIYFHEDFIKCNSKLFTLARGFNMSVVFFAIGYFYEVLDKKDFYHNFSSFWNSLSPSLHINPCVGFPFRSNFCIGRGERYYMFGKRSTSKPFFNLSLQQIQPASQLSKNPQKFELINSEIVTDDSYLGGSCYCINFTINPIDGVSDNYLRHTLFSTHITLPIGLYCIQFVYKTNVQPSFATLALELVFSNYERSLIYQNSDTDNSLISKIQNEFSYVDANSFNEDADINACFQGGHASDNSWIRYYSVLNNYSHADLKVVEVNLLIIPQQSPVVLNIQPVKPRIFIGEFSIHSINDLNIDWNDIVISDIVANHVNVSLNEHFNISAELTWDLSAKESLQSDIESIDIFCSTNNECQFVGKCMMVGFYYIEFSTKYTTNPSTVVFYLQPVLRSAVRQPIIDCPSITLQLNDYIYFT